MFFTSGITPRSSWMAILTPWIDIKTQKKKIKKFDILDFYSVLLINLSQTAPIHDLTAPNNRFFDIVLVGINIIIIRPI